MSRPETLESSMQIDLLPCQSRHEALGRLRWRALVVSVLTTALALVSARFVISAGFAIAVDSASHTEMVEGEILELQSELERRRSELMVLRDKRKVVSEIRAKKRVIARMLSVFSSLTPTTVTIRGVELTPTQIEVSGVARDVEAVRQWMKEIVAACGGYTPTLQQLRVVQFGRVRAHEFVAQIVRPQSLEKIEPCVTGEVSQGA